MTAKLERYTKMRSVGNRVLVRPENDEAGEKILGSGIIIPSTTKRSRPFREGRVLSVGPRVKEVRTGDFVMWPTRSGEFADGGYGYELMSILEADVVLILEKM